MHRREPHLHLSHCPIVVGRAAQVDELTRLLDSAHKGHRQIVLISGEAGIGKSRLIAEMKSPTAQHSARILEGRWYEPMRISKCVYSKAQMTRLKKHAAEKQRSAYSLNSDISTSVEFVNLSDEKIVVYWLDYDGQRQQYGELAPGQGYVQPTHLTHPWLITDEGGAKTLLFYPDAQPRRIEISFPSKRKKASRSVRAITSRRSR